LGIIFLIIIILAVLYATIFHYNSLFYLVQLDTDTALCLDGSEAFYYLSYGGNEKNIYLQFEMGGWCGEATEE
jgi:hypothetical protein